MSRQRRDITASEWFHVTNRGADRQDIFSLDGDHHLFEQLVADACDHHDALVHAYAWMTNHFHLVVRAPQQSLSSLMQRIGKRYGAAYNRRTNRTGPVFDHRFRSVPIVGDAQFIQACRYVHRNPLAFTHPRALAAYTGSSLGIYLGRRSRPSWLDTARLNAMIDTDHHLENLLADCRDDRLPLFDRPSVGTTMDELAAVVGSLPIHLSTSAVRSSRVLVVHLATELRVADSESLARRYGISQNAVRKLARRGRVLCSTDPHFQRQHDQALDHLTASSRLYPVPKGA